MSLLSDLGTKIGMELKSLWITVNGKLDITGKAADSDKFDGLDSTQFMRSDVANTATSTMTFTQGINTLHINDTSNQQLVLCAGEATIDASQVNELVYVNAEGGFQVAASNDNWVTGYAGTKKTIINYNGITYDGQQVMLGTKTISTSTPSGGVHGDMWIQV